MSALPFLSMKKIEVPRPATQILSTKSRNISSSNILTASMPRQKNTASSSPSPEYLSIERKDRISYENKVDDLLRGVSFKTIEPETIPGLIIVMKERKRKAVMSSNYTISQAADDMIGQLNSILIKRKHEAIRNKQILENQALLNIAKKQLETLTTKWTEKFEQFYLNQAEATKKLENQHVKELEEFENNIPKELPASFCKLSPDLLDMMEKEKQLVLTRRYDEAKSLKADNDKKKELETKEQKKKFLNMIEKQRTVLLKEQTHAIECFTLRWTRYYEKLKKEMDDEIDTQQKVIDNYEHNLNVLQSENHIK